MLITILIVSSISLMLLIFLLVRTTKILSFLEENYENKEQGQQNNFRPELHNFEDDLHLRLEKLQRARFGNFRKSGQIERKGREI